MKKSKQIRNEDFEIVRTLDSEICYDKQKNQHYIVYAHNNNEGIEKTTQPVSVLEATLVKQNQKILETLEAILFQITE